jgi:hypothetical protein
VSLAIPPGATPFWEDKWYLEWDARKHTCIIAVELADGSTPSVPADRIFTAQAFTAPDPGLRPVSINLRGWSPDYDSAGVSIEGSVPRVGHLGTIMYGLSAQDYHGMANGRGVYSNIARFDEGWAIVEFNATDLRLPKRKPDTRRRIALSLAHLLRPATDRDDDANLLERPVRITRTRPFTVWNYAVRYAMRVDAICELIFLRGCLQVVGLDGPDHAAETTARR